jgi:hypothetical protein
MSIGQELEAEQRAGKIQDAMLQYHNEIQHLHDNYLRHD